VRKANRILKRKGQFWQREWFDHCSRSPEHDDGIVKYIRQNPVKAGLASSPHEWPYIWTNELTEEDKKQSYGENVQHNFAFLDA